MNDLSSASGTPTFRSFTGDMSPPNHLALQTNGDMSRKTIAIQGKENLLLKSLHTDLLGIEASAKHREKSA